jgi:trans-aconitate methyltransferase
MAHDWQPFWAKESDPHYPAAADFLVNHAVELRLVCGDPSGCKVLELGCGSGALFEALGLSAAASYRGVDFSEKMLAAFRLRHPHLDLVPAEASAYVDRAQYDLIFSNQVAQYFSARMFARHIAHASAMLAPGGRLVVASIPWRGARVAHYLQSAAPADERRLLRGLAILARSLAGVDRLGRWYSYRECTAAASRHGLDATFFGCLQFPYRFHVRMEHARQH